jgi:hypothetical protein
MAEVEERFVLDLGSPTWRTELFDRFRAVHAATAATVPSTRWWLWGCFVSNHATPVMGNNQVMNALAILPEPELRGLGARLTMLVGFLQAAEMNYGVDAAIVYEFEPGDDRNVETLEALEGKWRPRAQVGIADHSTGSLVPAGFVEVLS